MKFEKISENKIKITLNTQDLAEKHIDFHSFMSNSLETQTLFLDMLDEAEKKVGFRTKDYKIRVEALAMSDGDFIVTVTRMSPKVEIEKELPAQLKSKKLNVKRKQIVPTSDTLVYLFNSFDDFIDFSNFIQTIQEFSNIYKTSLLYLYKDKYYLVFNKINLAHSQITKFYNILTEFSVYIHNSELFANKLSEHGKLIFKNNAITHCNNYFKKTAL